MFVQYSEYDAVPPVKQYILSDLCNSFSSKVSGKFLLIYCHVFYIARKFLGNWTQFQAQSLLRK